MTAAAIATAFTPAESLLGGFAVGIGVTLGGGCTSGPDHPSSS